jgi:HSP20 family protein
MQRSFIFQWTQLQRKLAGIEESARHESVSPAWSPNADVFEGPDGLLVRIELPGIAPDAVELHVDDQVLVIRGIRRDPQGSETAAGYRFRQMEIDFGHFERVLPLPFAVDGSLARAAIQHGLLTIRLPRAPTAQARHVRIQVGD